MGGCATKPRELKEEAAPRPIEEEEKKKAAAAVTEIQVTNDVVVDERKSLGHLFKEHEETKVESPETEEVTVKEAVVEPAVEAREDEQPKTQEPPADEKFITPPPEKTPAPSESIIATTEEKHVDTSSIVVDAETAPEVEAVLAESPKLEAKEDEQPKTQEPPADEKFITPVPEKTTPAPSEAIIAAAEEKKNVDSSSNVVGVQTAEVEAVVAESPKVEQKEAVAPTEEGNTAKVA